MTEQGTSQRHRYQRWSGKLRRGRGTWLTITSTGLRLALKQARTRTMLFGGITIGIATCAILYGLSYLEIAFGTEQAQGLYGLVRTLLHVDISGAARLEEFRRPLWCSVYLLTIRYQLFWVLIVVMTIGPRLISNDLKTRALPIYFSKPITPLTYLLGKWLIVALFVAAVMMLPNLLSWGLAWLITGGLSTPRETAMLGLHLLVSGSLVCLLSGAIVLALSSMTSDYRYVSVGWLAVCLIPVVAQRIINDVLPEDVTTGWLGCISIGDNIIVLTERLFGIRDAWEASSLPTEAFSRALVKPVDPQNALIVLGGWTVGALVICYRRVVRFATAASNL